MAITSTVDQVFLGQAEYLARSGEFLPGGLQALANKLQEATKNGKPLNIKLGLDPTRPDLHLGHTVVLRKLRAFQDLGHKVILIIGDATALIGDPSGRSETRPALTNEEIMANAETYLDQAGKVIAIEHARIVRNSEWLLKLGLEDLLKLASKTTVAQMMARDDFSKRYAENRPISLHELLYPLMQAYDSVVIDADIELGGSDQRFNTLLGRDMQLAFGKKTDPQSVLLMPIIEGTDGKVKMSKSYPDHCINLTDSAPDMFGKIMSIPDTLIFRYMELLTGSTPEVIANIKTNMEQGNLHPRNVKAELAKVIVADYHDHQQADDAEVAFTNQFRNNEIPKDIPTVMLKAEGHPLLALMVEHGLAPSKSEARRLVQGGGVKLDGEKIIGDNPVISENAGTEKVLQVGRRKFLKLIFE